MKIERKIITNCLVIFFCALVFASAQNTDSKLLAESLKSETREFLLEKTYLNFPVKNGAEKRLVSMNIDGDKVREFDIELAPAESDFWVFLHIDQFQGKKAILRIDKYDPNSQGFKAVHQADTFPGQENLYKEKLRPQFHFTSKRGWNNDTNGLVYYKGQYHMFYQHNPYGWPWGNMTWGHAVSKDLVHWTELPDAIHPDELGIIASGSAVVDTNNTAGFQSGSEKPIVCFYTSTGELYSSWAKGKPFTQSLAYSNDNGRTFTKYKDNPIIGEVKYGTRDPKVIWHEPTGKWVMAIYMDGVAPGDPNAAEKVRNSKMGFFTSSDLKFWEFESDISAFVYECPELFELAVDGDINNKKWILYGGTGEYWTGYFDGKKFHKEIGPTKFSYGNCFYASQTFNNIPSKDGRRIQMAWGRVDMPDMPFNQMILFPVTLTLRTTPEGLRMYAEPVREIENLHKNEKKLKNAKLSSARKLMSELKCELYRIKASLKPEGAAEVGFSIRGIEVVYDVKNKSLKCGDQSAPMEAIDGQISLELLVDRTTIEIFGNDGQIYMPIKMNLTDKAKSYDILSKQGNCKVESLEIYELKSVWN